MVKEISSPTTATSSGQDIQAHVAQSDSDITAPIRPRGEANVGPTKTVQTLSQPIRRPHTLPPRPARHRRDPTATGTAPGRGTGPRHARTSTQRARGGCVAHARRGGRRLSLGDLSGCPALSRDRVCFATPPISRCAPHFSHCIRRLGAAHEMTNKRPTNQ